MTDAARRILLAILVLGVIGITIELLLLGHDEDLNQFIPLALAAAALLVSVVVSLKPSFATVRVFQFVMVLLIISGAVGVYLHFGATSEFQLEMDPTLSGLALFRKAIVAKAPPALAPGAMTQLGLIGLAYTFRHPALQSGRTP
jgi:uncharacterized membrane protein HdeD (DUF308 family)